MNTGCVDKVISDVIDGGAEMGSNDAENRANF
jgi:hypothetical protein